ncbi:MAG: membrane protein insertase YidC [Alphaproteobacteria bacterium]|nr:MAG: membrane protein insertase YidC [Alphaproteobacteria bacterium]
MNNNNQDGMHPEDMRNLIIFGVLSLIIWFLYETYILGPQAKALKAAKEARIELIVEDPQLLEPVQLVSREEALSQTPRISFDNGEVFGTISLKGGKIDDLSLSLYHKTLEKKEHVTLFTPRKTETARYVDYGWVTSDKNVDLPGASTLWQVQGNSQVLTPGAPITLVWNNEQGLRFERVIALDNEYLFTITQKVYNQSGRDVTLYPYALISQTDIPKDYHRTWISHEGPMGFIDGALEKMYYAAMVSEPDKRIEAQRGWIGISDKYWLAALMPAQDTLSKYRFKYTPDPVTKKRNRYQTDFTGAPHILSAGGMTENSYHMYAGVKKVLTLKAYQEKLGIDNLDLAVDFGWFWFLTYPFFLALHYLGLLFGNMGVAIIVLTIIVRSAVFPLTRVSYRSFAKMKVITPQITELRAQCGDDKEKLQAAIVELYKKEGVNPMSGCLPMIAQIPIFFAFYKVLFSTIEIRHAPFFGWIEDLSARDPTTVFNLFGLFPWGVPEFLMIGAWPCLMLLATMMQKQLNPPPQDKMQRDMMIFFPFFITFIMAKFASGLVIYWTFSAVLGIIQQSLIMRSMGVPVYFFNKDKFEQTLETQVEEGPDVHPLIDMAEQEAEKALFGDEDAEIEVVPDIKPPKPKKKTQKKKKK